MAVKPGKDRKLVYRCSDCGYAQSKWAGQCPGCGAWNSLMEGIEDRAPAAARFAGYAGATEHLAPVSLADVEAEEVQRTPCGLEEFDRVLGGGLVPGSAVLIGGDPGIGK